MVRYARHCVCYVESFQMSGNIMVFNSMCEDGDGVSMRGSIRVKESLYILFPPCSLISPPPPPLLLRPMGSSPTTRSTLVLASSEKATVSHTINTS